MKKNWILTIFILFSLKSIAQSSDWKDRMVFGGSAMPMIGQGALGITVLPLAGYRISDNFIAGVQVPFSYVRVRVNPSRSISQNSFGITPFARYFPFENFFLHGEFENISLQLLDPVTLNPDGRMWFSAPMVGGGYGSSQGGFYAMALYIPNWDPNRSLYFSPLVLRVGVMF